MKKILINEIPTDNYGANNYSCGMEAIIFNPKDIKIEDVVKLPNVFLHPTHAANSLEIFAVMGTEEQYKKFYEYCKSCECTNIAVKERGGMPKIDDRDGWDELGKRIEELEAEFKPWYNMVLKGE